MSWSAPLSSELQSFSYLSEKERERGAGAKWRLNAACEKAGCTFKFEACAKSRPWFAFLAFSTPELFSIAHEHEGSSGMWPYAWNKANARRIRSLQLSSQAEGKFELFWDKHTRWLFQLVWRNIKGHTEAHVGKINLWLQSNLLVVKEFIMYIMRHTMCLNIP